MADQRRPPRIVGVLGGMGPAATVDFYGKLVAHTPATTDAEHLQVLIWSDPTVPSRQDALLREGEDPTPWVRRGLERLVRAGAEILVIPCNTVHAFLVDAIPDGAEFISILDVTMAALRRRGSGEFVGVLATDGALASNLFQTELTQAGFTAVLPDTAQQATLTEIIEAVKAHGNGGESAERLHDIINALRDNGVETCIVGCTELSVVIAEADLSNSMDLIDPSLELALAAIAAAQSA